MVFDRKNKSCAHFTFMLVQTEFDCNYSQILNSDPKQIHRLLSYLSWLPKNAPTRA